MLLSPCSALTLSVAFYDMFGTMDGSATNSIIGVQNGWKNSYVNTSSNNEKVFPVLVRQIVHVVCEMQCFVVIKSGLCEEAVIY